MSRGVFLTPKEQVNHCESKGIQFNKISKTKAISYLKINNNYFKLRSFRKNFIKDSNLNRYKHLDFADLIDLAIIDHRLRRILLEMALGIEHFSKVHLLSVLQSVGEDGYLILQDYLKQLSEDNRKRLDTDLKKNTGSTYCGNLYRKYMQPTLDECPVWVFIEVISFGQYLYFYDFCIKRVSALYDDTKTLELRLYLMRTVKDLRNACAHNNCIINDLKAPLSKKIKPNYTIAIALSKIGISKKSRNKHLNRSLFYQLTVIFYAHILIVTSSGVHRHIAEELKVFQGRLYRDHSYDNNDIIKSTFDLISKLIDNWFRIL